MLAKSIAIILIAVMTPIAMAIGAFMQNRIPWSDPPGFSKRLRTYVTTNVAETAVDPEFPELRVRSYPLPQDRMLPVVEQAMQSLGWDIPVSGRKGHGIQAVVTTPLWQFQDEVTVTLQSVEGDAGTWVNVRSGSRTGRGDFGTNTRHILDLYAAMEQVIGQVGRE